MKLHADGGPASARIVFDLTFGDGGKGKWVDYLVRKHGVKYVVRYNGGAQAAHHVWTIDGRRHCFKQFGSGMFLPWTKTVLTKYMLVDPQYLFEEATALRTLGVASPLDRLIISRAAPIITPFNRLFNRIQEVSRGASPHGSCGFGVGVTQGDVEQLGEQALYIGDLLGRKSAIVEKLLFLQQRRLDQAQAYLRVDTADLIQALVDVDLYYYAEMFKNLASAAQIVSNDDIAQIASSEDTIWEGAQGVMLDQNYGTFPHCTRSNTVPTNALSILDGLGVQVEKHAVVRGYGTRHGAGPFPTEDRELPIVPCDNAANLWQGQFRVGALDAVMVRYALKVVGGVDVLAVTNLDRMVSLPEVKVASSYDGTDPRFFDEHGEMVVPDIRQDGHLSWLAARTEVLNDVQPRYRQIAGWRDPHEGASRFLPFLSEIFQHPVNAYSASRDYQNTYVL